MRFVAASALIHEAIPIFRTEPATQAAVLHVIAGAAGLLLFVGLWTTISGLVAALVELWTIYSQDGDPWPKILLGTLCVASALLGPGVWSVDAGLYGWKRIDIRVSETRKSHQDPR
jgi:uncharacterized membrane protein YphA (DoxX/SURF4 family)